MRIDEPEIHHLRVPRTARYAVLGDPGAAGELWVVVHGYRQLASRFIRRFRELPGLAAGLRAVVAPEALSRFYVEREAGPHGPESRVGASWMTREDREHEIRDYVEYLDRLVDSLDAGTRRVVVLGFSQGCETASRWVSYGTVRPCELVLWGGGLAEDLDRAPASEALRRLEQTTFVVGDRDPWAKKRAAASLRALREWGLTGERVDYAGGHAVNPEVLAAGWPAG